METQIKIKNEIARLRKIAEKSQKRIKNLSTDDIDFNKKFNAEYEIQIELIKEIKILEYLIKRI